MTRGGVRSDPHVLNYFDSNVLAIGDIPWSYRLSGVYELHARSRPADMAVLGRHSAGRCRPRHQREITLPQGNRSRVRGFGSSRFPNTAQLDLGVRKVFHFGSRSLVQRIDIFNSTNQATVDALVTQLGPTYGRIGDPAGALDQVWG